MTAHRSDCSKHGYDDERGHKDVDPDAPCDCGVEALERAIAKIDVDTMIAEKLAALSAAPAPPAGETHESMGVHAPQWCATCSKDKPMAEWVTWPCQFAPAGETPRTTVDLLRLATTLVGADAETIYASLSLVMQGGILIGSAPPAGETLESLVDDLREMEADAEADIAQDSAWMADVARRALRALGYERREVPESEHLKAVAQAMGYPVEMASSPDAIIGAVRSLVTAYQKSAPAGETARERIGELATVVRELLEANQGVWSHSEQGRAYIRKCEAALRRSREGE